MNISKLFIGFLLFILVSACYKDKGHYDYKEVNDFEVTINPAPANEETNLYLVNQPGVEADTFRLTAEGRQTQNNQDNNLEYIWYRTLSIDKKEVSSDTIYGKENAMELAASKKSEWKILLIVRDKSMDLEYYKSITVKTKFPFYHSWLFVHGEQGDRKLGALSWNEDGTIDITQDIMAAMGQPGFPYMTKINYTSDGSDDNDFERLFIISAPDSITYTYPFSGKVKGRYRQMGVPSNVKIKEMVNPRTGWAGGFLGLITEDGKLYYSHKRGIPQFKMTSGNVSSDYKIDMAYMDIRGYITMWDNTNKRLMHYVVQKKGEEIEGYLGYMGTLGAKDLMGKKGLWLGRDAQTVSGDQEPCLFIAKSENSDKCYLYHISYNEKDKALTKGDDGKDEGKDEYASGTVTCDSTHAWGFTENSLFAISDYYQDQFFFTEGNAVYRGIMANGEREQLYVAPGTIKKIAFRYTNSTSATFPIDYNSNMRILGILITNTDGTDEIHELHLTNGGDVEEEHVYDLDEVKVVDWRFTDMDRNPDR